MNVSSLKNVKLFALTNATDNRSFWGNLVVIRSPFQNKVVRYYQMPLFYLGDLNLTLYHIIMTQCVYVCSRYEHYRTITQSLEIK